jgi:hypothetical protein
VYLVWAARDEGEQSRLTVQLGALILPFVVIVGGVLGYYAHKAGFHSLLYALWDYPFKFAAAEHSFPFRSYLYKIPPHRTPGDLARMAPFVFIHLLIPFAYLFCLVRLFREKTRMDRRLWEHILLINLVGLALFAAVAAGPSYHRLCMIAPPAIVLCVWYFSGETRVDRTVRGLCWSISIVLFLYLPVRLQLLPRTYLDLPTGRTAFLSLPEYEETRWLAGQTHAGDSFFNLTQVSFVLALQNPTPVDFVTPTEITPPEQVDAVVRSLEVHQTPFVFLPQFYAPREIIDSLQPFREYVYNNYHLAKAFPSGQFWERN